MKVLIGNTGLVGQTLAESINFDLLFNSKTIDSIKSYDLTDSTVYLSCLPATKWQVNLNPIQDLINMTSIVERLMRFRFSKIILISTIDVYSESPLRVDETFSPIVTTSNYGSNRYLFELAIKKLQAETFQIFRLPALFGPRIKKNILYDLLNDNQVHKINYNSSYQWYNLARLVSDISNYSDKAEIVNLFTEPVQTSKILDIFNIKSTQVDTNIHPVKYDWLTCHEEIGYIADSQSVIKEITDFVNAYKRQPSSYQ